MYFRIIRNDIAKSKTITFTVLIFVVVAAMLISLASVLFINLSGAIGSLMTKAKTPHFMQMHTGEMNQSRLHTFARNNHNVDEFQILEFLNIDGEQIIINGSTFANNVQDNGLSMQSDSFDYLLDLNGSVITVLDGELYVPICYRRDSTAKVGDKAVISGKEFRIKGFLRDSQMNSTLSSSKRFLVSKNDYQELKSCGSTEYLIEFRLKDLSKLSAFETAYTAAGLEANGPTVTYPLFKMLNAISDGILIGIILFMSVFVVIIACLCIRFTLLARMEEDYREIGVMKAIGIRLWDIKKIYLVKYTAISFTGCVLGLFLSLLFKNTLLTNIRLYMGESNTSYLAFVGSILGNLLLFLFIMLYVNRVLSCFKKISGVQAIRFGAEQEKIRGIDKMCLSNNKLLNTNVFYGMKDVLVRKKLYVTLLLVLMIAMFIIIVPNNLYSTISSKSFIRYMGIGGCDMRMDIQQVENISDKALEISKIMDSDNAISKYSVLITKSFTAITDDNTKKKLKIELGNHSIFPVTYIKGQAPVSEDEIALSAMNAKELGKEVGDSFTIYVDKIVRNLRVCGIYSDITNGGKTAKATFTNASEDVIWCVICAKFTDSSLSSKWVSKYTKKFPEVKMCEIDTYVRQTFGQTMHSIQKASVVAVIVALIITLLISLLFMKMLVTKDKYSIAVMKVLGFTNVDILVQYMTRSIFVLLLGILLGTLLANTFGEALAGKVIASYGVATFHFEKSPLFAYLFAPLMMVGTMLIGTLIGTSNIETIKISDNMKE